MKTVIGGIATGCIVSAVVAVLAEVGTGDDDQRASVPVASRVESAEIENLYRLSPRIYSGAQPEGRSGFDALQHLGIRTIISVDGAAPDVKAARARGMRYVHVPIGYDGVPDAQALKIVKAARELPGPIFVHCHHGRHRGPAAAALCAVALERWSRDRATGWMKTAGTSPDYQGLFQSVTSLRIPSASETAQTAVDLPETAPVSTLVEIMVEVDRDWDRLKAVRAARYKNSEKSGELTGQQAALQLAERFRELSRRESESKAGQSFGAAVREARDATDRLDQALSQLASDPTDTRRAEADTAFDRVGKTCTMCHKRFRDAPDRN